MQVTQYKRSVREVSKEFNIPHKTLGRYCIAKRSHKSNASVQTEAIHECQAFPLSSNNDIICEFLQQKNSPLMDRISNCWVRLVLRILEGASKAFYSFPSSNKFGYVNKF